MDKLSIINMMQEYLYEAYWPQTLLKAIQTEFLSPEECVKSIINLDAFFYHISAFQKSDFLDMLAKWTSDDLQAINHKPEGWFIWINKISDNWNIDELITLLSGRLEVLWGATLMLTKWFPSLDDDTLYRIGRKKPEWIEARYAFVQSPKTLMLWMERHPEQYFLKAISPRNSKRFLSLWKTCDHQTLLEIITGISRQELLLNEGDQWTKRQDIELWSEMVMYIPWNTWLKNPSLKLEQKNVLLTLFLHIRMCAKLSGHEDTLKLTNNIIKMWPNGQQWRDIQDVMGAAWKIDMAKSFIVPELTWSH